MLRLIGVNASAGGVPVGFESIASATGTGSSGTITFSSIPSTYQHLQIRALLRSTQASTGFTNLNMRLNGVSASSYAIHRLTGSGSAVSAEGYASQLLLQNGIVVRDNEAANIHGVVIIDIHDYADSTKNTTTRFITGYDENGDGRIQLGSGLFVNTSAISSIELYLGSDSFTTSTQFALYGIKGA